MSERSVICFCSKRETPSDLMLRDGVRVFGADRASDVFDAKSRRGQFEKMPYVLIAGERGMAARVDSPRTRDGQHLPVAPVDKMAKRLVVEAVPPVVGGTSQSGSISPS